MRKLGIHIIRIAAVISALAITLSAPGAAGQDEDSLLEAKITDSEWQPMMRPLYKLGITGMQCNCSFVYGEDESIWLFHSEPKIRAVDGDGPSYGKLEKGDVIVAIDGALITTHRGGELFTGIEAGAPVALTVRRRGRTREVTVVPQAIIARPVPMVRPDVPGVAEAPAPPEIAELARSVEELSKRAAKLSMKHVDMTLELPELLRGRIDYGKMLPKGWVGFALTFSGSIRHKDENKPAEWRFNDPPSIKSVHPESPADLAGLQIGDELLEIDGLKLDSRKGGDRFSHMQPGQVIEWKVRRGAKKFTVETTAGDRPAQETLYTYKLPGVPAPLKSQQVRFTGSIAGADIEVRGRDEVLAEVDEKTGEIVIKIGDTVVRVKEKK